MKYIQFTLLFAFTFFLLIPHATNAQQSKKVMLAGYKQHPAVGTSGSGMFTVKLQGDTLLVQGDFSKLMSRFTGAYIMVGKPGEKGNALYTLKVKTNEKHTGGTLTAEGNTHVLNEAQKALLKKGNLYFLVASAKHPNGEIVSPIPPMGNE
ncbi:MAG: CHRD domain-containing protein [Balneolaceae bacterium]|jgi:hypothetical protein